MIAQNHLDLFPVVIKILLQKRDHFVPHDIIERFFAGDTDEIRMPDLMIPVIEVFDPLVDSFKQFLQIDFKIIRLFNAAAIRHHLLKPETL